MTSAIPQETIPAVRATPPAAAFSMQDVLMAAYCFGLFFLNNTPYVFVPNALFAGSLLLFSYRLVTGRETLTFNLTITLFGIILLGSLLPVLTGLAADTALAQEHVVRSAYIGVFLVLLASYMNSLERIRLVTLASMAGFVAAFAVGHLLLQITRGGRPSALYVNPNEAGFVSLIVLTLLALLVALRDRLRTIGTASKALMLVALACSGALIYLSQSRKSLLALGVLLGLLGLKHLRSMKSRLVAVGLVASALLAIPTALALFPDLEIVQRFSTLLPSEAGQVSGDASVGHRIDFYKAGFEMVYDNFFVGYGGGAFSAIGYKYSTLFDMGWDLHSALLNSWIESGLIGFVGFLMLFASKFWKALRNLESPISTIVVAITIGMLIVMSGTSGYLNKYMWLLLLLIDRSYDGLAYSNPVKPASSDPA